VFFTRPNTVIEANSSFVFDGFKSPSDSCPIAGLVPSLQVATVKSPRQQFTFKPEQVDFHLGRWMSEEYLLNNCRQLSRTLVAFVSNKITRLFSLKNIVNLQNQLSHDRKHLRKWPSEEEKTVVTHPKNDNLEASPPASTLSTEASLNESLTDGSERDASLESSVDADSEASEPEIASKQPVLLRSRGDSCGHAEQHPHLPLASELPQAKETHGGEEEMAEAIAELHLSGTVTGNRDFHREKQPLNVPNNLCFSEGKHTRLHSAQNAFQTLSQSYVTTSKECSVQSCLYQFTSMELLMGNNKLLCEDCTEKRRKCHKETSSAGKQLIACFLCY
jgi:hypothetical protein